MLPIYVWKSLNATNVQLLTSESTRMHRSMYASRALLSVMKEV